MSGAGCSLSHTYHAAPWERFWRANVSSLAGHTFIWERGCTALMRDQPLIDEWLSVAAARLEDSSVPWHHRTMSYFDVNDCHGKHIAKEPIEPLVGMLRHPLFHCQKMQKRAGEGRSLLNTPATRQWLEAHHGGSEQRMLFEDFRGAVNTSHLLPAAVPAAFHGARPRAIMFDVGASTYNDGDGGASMSWFVETYRRLGITFERFFAWEKQIHAPQPLFSKMPVEVLDSLSYFNIPIEVEAGARHNPLRTLKAVARPSDFVVLKVDFDADVVEQALVQQILDDSVLTSLVDELYFEHHVYDIALALYKYGPKGEPKGPRLQDSYELFSKLREAGIRAHSWV